LGIFTLTDKTFEAFGFAEPLSRALKQCAYETPTPIQIQALPPQLQNRDLVALAETGSGKTATFVLPILHHLANVPIDPNPREVVTLILAPTRELAVQIDAEVASLSRNMNIRRAVVLGGVSKGPQVHALKRGVHVLVATPGRLLDHVSERHADLRSVRTLVLDEADRMFDMGFIRDIRKIVSLLPRQRRTALFSATMPTEIRALTNELLTDPVRVDISPKQMVVDRIDQKVMIVRANEKQSRLHTLLADEAFSRVIVFTRTKRGADRVCDRLGMAGIGSVAMHGNKAQNARQRALSDFAAGHVRVMVATDIAARGIDVSDVTHIVNFDMPLEAETYVHRIGRTARKGKSGFAISLCDPSERGEILAIERLMKQKIEVIDDVGGETLPTPERRPQHVDPRRESAHRKGARPMREGGREGSREGGRGGDGRGRDHDRQRSSRAEVASPRGKPAAVADRAPRSEHGSSTRPAYDPTAQKRPRAPGQPEAARHTRAHAHRLDTGPRSDQPRAERPHHDRPQRDGARSDARHVSGPRRDERHTSPRVDRAPTHEGAKHHTRNERNHDEPRHRGAHADASRGKDSNWNGQQPPKFLKQRDDTRSGRNNRKPAA
jgi:ATP-dependent RNA helicase RhlE